jgi:hypothetical protein
VVGWWVGEGVDGGDDGLGGTVGQLGGQDGRAGVGAGEGEPVVGGGFGAVGVGAVPEVGTRTPQLAQVTVPSEVEQEWFDGAELGVVAFDAGGHNGVRGAAGDLAVGAGGAGGGEEVADLAGVDGGAGVALAHAGVAAEPRAGGG